MSLLVCIYCSLELKSDGIIWYGWKVDAGYDEFPSDGKETKKFEYTPLKRIIWSRNEAKHYS